MERKESEIYKTILKNCEEKGLDLQEIEKFLERVEEYVKELKISRAIDSLLEKEGIEILYDYRKNSFLRGKLEITKKEKKIVIYPEVLREDEKKGVFTFNELLEITKAHEYFHYLEYKKEIDLTIVEKRNKYWWQRKKAINYDKLEILCHHYVKKLLGLKISPIVLDYYKEGE